MIRYARRPEMETADDKLTFLGGRSLRGISTEVLQPDRKQAWIDQAGDKWFRLLPLVSKEVKAGMRFLHQRRKEPARRMGLRRKRRWSRKKDQVAHQGV